MTQQMLVRASLADAECPGEDAVYHIGEERTGGDKPEIDRVCSKQCRALVRNPAVRRMAIARRGRCPPAQQARASPDGSATNSDMRK
jgi:hypothetical protein